MEPTSTGKRGEGRGGEEEPATAFRKKKKKRRVLRIAVGHVNPNPNHDTNHDKTPNCVKHYIKTK